MRNFIQRKLNELSDVDSGPFQADDLLEKNKVYFGYQIQEDNLNWDMNKNSTYQVSIIGYASLKENSEINSLAIIDDARKLIVNKLKEINFRCSYKDVSIENGIRKIQITGNTKYNEINKKMII